jgi:sporulation protein YlmC with PRC-barrel domain
MMEFRDWQGKAVVDRDGKKIGNIGQLYVDDRYEEPAWATVRTGMLGNKENFFPVSLAHAEGDEIMIDMPADDVKNAPSIEADKEIDVNEEEALFAYYQEKWGAESSTEEAKSHTQEDERMASKEGDMGTIDTRGRANDTAMGTITETDGAPDMAARSQEDRLARDQENKQVHLRKYTVTELVTEDGKVQHKEVVIERQPVDEPQADTSLNQDTKQRPLTGGEDRPRDTRGDSDF